MNTIINNVNYHSKELDDYSVVTGGIAVDIGAALGEFPKKYHSEFDFIYCFEPVYSNYIELLNATKEYNNVICYPLAFASKNQKTLKIYNNGENKYNYSAFGADEETEYQLSLTIDLKSILELCEGTIDYLKMDCEGSEIYLNEDNNVQYINNIGLEAHTKLIDWPKLKKWLNNYFNITEDLRYINRLCNCINIKNK